MKLRTTVEPLTEHWGHILFSLFLVFCLATYRVDQVLPDKGPTVRFVLDSIPEYRLEGRAFNGNDLLGNPTHIAVGSQYILVPDFKASQPLHIFSRQSESFVTSAGTYGKGPREVEDVWHIDWKPGHDSGWIFEYESRKIHYVNLDSLVDTQLISDRNVALVTEGTPVSPVWISDDRIATTGFYTSGRLHTYSSQGEFLSTMGPDPPGSLNTPVPVRQHAYIAYNKTNSDGRRIAVAFQYTDRLEIYEDGELSQLVRGPVFKEPTYTVYHNEEGVSWMGLDAETVYGYIDTAVTDSLIFGLYSGEPRHSSRGIDSDLIIVFDWHGKPLAQLKFASKLSAIGVSANGSDLYAARLAPVPMIVHYPIPDFK